MIQGPWVSQDEQHQVCMACKETEVPLWELLCEGCRKEVGWDEWT